MGHRARLIAVLVLALALLGCGSDIATTQDKQRKIDECTASGGYPALDPQNFYVVYCSRVPVCRSARVVSGPIGSAREVWPHDATAG